MFDTLLWDCFEGPNRCEADGLSAHIGRMPKACAGLAFRLDSEAFRKAVGLDGQGARCCDRLLLLLQRPPSGDPKLFFYLLEMKGCMLEDAVEQLASTLQALQRHLGARLIQGRAKFYAVIVSDRASPGQVSAYQPDFARKYKANLYTVSARRSSKGTGGADLSALLPEELTE